MALIKCSECGKEISDQAERCPDCGCPIGKGKKRINKKLLIIPIVIVVVGVVGGILLYKRDQIIKRQERINDATKRIESLLKEGIPSQKDYDDIVKLYEGLPSDEKKEVKNADQLNKYKDVDLKVVENISRRIASVGDATSFSEIIAIENDYKKLTEGEQKLLNIAPIAERKSLTNVEKAALAAAKNVRSLMKSKDSFKLRSVSVKNDLKKMKFYWIKMEYSGINSWGASVDKMSCFSINSEFKDLFFGLAQITGNIDEYLDSWTNYDEYTDCKKKENNIDVEKIMYYMK